MLKSLNKTIAALTVLVVAAASIFLLLGNDDGSSYATTPLTVVDGELSSSSSSGGERGRRVLRAIPDSSPRAQLGSFADPKSVALRTRVQNYEPIQFESGAHFTGANANFGAGTNMNNINAGIGDGNIITNNDFAQLTNDGSSTHADFAQLIQLANADPADDDAPPPTMPTTTVLRPYSLDNVLLAPPHFAKQFFVVMYVANMDQFFAYYGKDLIWNSGCGRIRTCGNLFVKAFRRFFDTHEGSKKDLVFLASTGDQPKIDAKCLASVEGRKECGNDDFAPVLGFGSVFSDEALLPSLVAMPMAPPPHTPCFRKWYQTSKVCRFLLPRFQEGEDTGDGLVFGKDVGLEWEDLIPTVIWRGTNFGFLTGMFPHLRMPDFDADVAPKMGIKNEQEAASDPRAVVSALFASWDTYLPRWRGAVLTAEAELDAAEETRKRHAAARRDANAAIQGKPATLENLPVVAPLPAAVPWADIKFSHYIDGDEHSKISTSKSEYFQYWAKMGLPAAGASMNMLEHAKYKYHTDLGGGGGTTWTGTILKLSLPGLLFHHVTPTKDWIHDHIRPWVHYVPIKMDLSDLKEKFDWAESHPEEAKKISEAATEFAKKLGTEEGFGEIYDHYYVDNLERLIDAYQPADQKSAKAIMTWLEGAGLERVMSCPASTEDCQLVGRVSQW